jgi:hypothetical protein
VSHGLTARLAQPASIASGAILQTSREPADRSTRIAMEGIISLRPLSANWMTT